MAGLLDMSNFTFEGELLMSVSEMAVDEFLQAPEIQLIHTLYPNIVTDKEIGFIGQGGLVGKVNQGCNPTAQNWSITSRVLKWEPTDWEILIHECYTNLKTSAAAYSLNTGTAIADFTNTDYMNIVVEVLAEAMKKFVIRLVWFSDVDAADITGGGDLTDGTDADYFNLLDGLFKQINTQITANPAQLVAIAENAAATYVLQKLAPANVQGYLNDVYFGAPLVLRGKSDGMMIVTQTVFDAYVQSLQGTNLESMLVNTIEGLKAIKSNGITVVAMPIFDEIILEYYNTGAKLDNPHRIIYTAKSVLGVGVDNVNSFSNLEVWYDRDSRNVKIEAMGIADAKLINPDLFMLGM